MAAFRPLIATLLLAASPALCATELWDRCALHLKGKEEVALDQAYLPQALRHGIVVMERKTTDLTGGQISNSLFLGDKTVGEFWTRYTSGVLSFDIEIKNDFRRKGLYASLLGIALEQFPETKAIPAIMASGGSENCRHFMSEVFGDGRWDRSSDPWDYENLAALRTRMIEAFKSTPAYKARAANGFKAITYLRMSPATETLVFVVEKGTLPDAATIVDIQVSGLFGAGLMEITSSGESIAFDGRHVPYLNEYKSLRTWRYNFLGF